MKLPNDEIIHYESEDGISIDITRTELVHCPDCKYMKLKKDPFGYTLATCEYARWVTVDSEGFEHCGLVRAYDYCSYGERKEE